MSKKNKITIQARAVLVLIFLLVGVFFLLISLFLVTCVMQNDTHNKLMAGFPLANFDVKKAQTIDTAMLDNRYRQEVSDTIKKYLIQDAQLATNDHTAKIKNVKEALDTILGLTLTGIYKDVHLNLVLALDEAQRGYEAYLAEKKIEGQKLLQQSAEKMDEIMQANIWLKTE